MFDVVIRHGEIVTAAGSILGADIGISNGSIAQIGGVLAGHLEIDATGKLVLPGGIDAHVHLSGPPEEEDVEPKWVDDFASGSAAALAGGITTIGNMTFPASDETPLAGKAPSSLLTITLAAIHPRHTLESSVRSRDCARTRHISIIWGLKREL